MAAEESRLESLSGSLLGWTEYTSSYTFGNILPSYIPSNNLSNIMWVKSDDDVFPIFYHHQKSCFNNPEGVAIVFFHGNASDLGDNIKFLKSLAKMRDCSVYSIEYPGYGSSHGVPNEISVNHRMIRGLHFIHDNFNVPYRRMILMGHSVGAAVLLGIVSKNEERFAGIFLINTFSSLKDIASDIYEQEFSFGFIGKLAGSAFDTASMIKKLKTIPIMIFHCEGDEIIGYDHAQRLFEAGKHLTYCYLQFQDGGKHNLFSIKALYSALTVFMSKIQDEVASVTKMIRYPSRLYPIDPTLSEYKIDMSKKIRKPNGEYFY